MLRNEELARNETINSLQTQNDNVMEEFRQEQDLAFKQKAAEIYEKMIKIDMENQQMQNENSIHEQEQQQIYKNK